MNEPEIEESEAAGRSGGGESGGGAYPNPHRGRKPAKDGFLGRGGQTGMDYHGGGNPNASAGGRRADSPEDE